jgi:hypothetical protein
METIQVWKSSSDPNRTTPLGKGEGTYDKKAGTATIQTWIDATSLTVDTNYKLKIGRAHYTGTCSSNQTTQPVATFRDVE